MACQGPWTSGGGSGPQPLLLVPGVCGTMLAVREAGASGDGERCWVTVRNADAAYQKLWGKYSKDSGRAELLTPGQEVTVPQGDDESGLYPISVLDPDVGFALRQVHYFEPLIAFLQTQGLTPGVSLFGCGYDFRQSCRASARRLLERLQEVSRRCGGRRVDVVTHSMGGLVVRSLLADFPAEFEALVNKWVAIGCPFGGAPGYAVDALLTGVQFAGSLGSYFFVDRGTFRQACLQSPAIYELLPPLDFPYAQPPPQLTLWLKDPIPEGASSATPCSQATRAPPASGAAEGDDGLLGCVTHARYAVHAALQPPPQQPGAAPAAAKLALPRISLISSSSTAGTHGTGTHGGTSGTGGGGGSGSGSSSNQAHQYVFQHDALPGLLTRLLKDNSVSVAGVDVALPFDPELWALGQATHAAWKGARLPPSCAFYNLHGSGLGTPYSAQYGTWWYTVQDLPSVVHANASFTYVAGDATVPTESATAHGLRDTATAAIKGGHRDLIAMQEVWDQVMDWLRAPQPGSFSQAASTCGSASQPPAMAPRSGVDKHGCQGPVQHHHLQSGGKSGTLPKAAAAGLEDTTFWNPLLWQALLT